jgi:SAM-dependent methyltransferase
VEKPAKEIQWVKNISKRLSKQGFLNRDFKYLVKPIDFTRTLELPAVLGLSEILYDKRNNLKILDISSPQILSASIAEVSQNWQLTYINPFQPELDEMRKIKNYLSYQNIFLSLVDMTNIKDFVNLNDNYDYIFSASVFEHIHPEDGGDTIAVRNIYSLLKPKGLFIFSVPFYKQSFNEYKYGDVYSIKSEENRKIFFQRFYDEKALYNQLIIPSGLNLESISFIGERYYFTNNIHKRFAQRMQSKISSIIFGKLYFLISKLLFSYSDNYKNLKKPYISVVALRKNQ